jgi:methylated-DNA-[protein]-cysteine S-methyltransferase
VNGSMVDGYALFDTPIGRCGIAWGERGLLGLQLPEADEEKALARIRRRWPGLPEAPPSPEAARAIEGIVALLGGTPRDLSEVTLDLRGVPEFDRRVYAAARTISPGATLTYGEVAARLGEPGAAREVGQALGRNPFAIVVPCHRVVAAGGRGKPRYGEATVCWAASEAEARKTALDYWPISGLKGELTAELATPAHFEQAAQLVTEEMIAEAVVCGPDPERHVAKLREYLDAGYDHVWVRFYEREVLPKLR